MPVGTLQQQQNNAIWQNWQEECLQIRWNMHSLDRWRMAFTFEHQEFILFFKVHDDEFQWLFHRRKFIVDFFDQSTQMVLTGGWCIFAFIVCKWGLDTWTHWTKLRPICDVSQITYVFVWCSLKWPTLVECSANHDWSTLAENCDEHPNKWNPFPLGQPFLQTENQKTSVAANKCHSIGFVSFDIWLILSASYYQMKKKMNETSNWKRKWIFVGTIYS